MKKNELRDNLNQALNILHFSLPTLIYKTVEWYVTI